MLSTIDTGGSRAIFDVRLDPFDPTGTTFYASDQSASRLLVVDALAGKITKTIPLDKNPSQIAFLDAQWLVVSETDHDALAVVDRIAGTVEARIEVFEASSPRGFCAELAHLRSHRANALYDARGGERGRGV